MVKLSLLDDLQPAQIQAEAREGDTAVTHVHQHYSGIGEVENSFVFTDKISKEIKHTKRDLYHRLIRSVETAEPSGRAWHCSEAVAQLWGIYLWFTSPINLTVDGQGEGLTAILMTVGFTYYMGVPPNSFLTLSTCGPGCTAGPKQSP